MHFITNIFFIVLFTLCISVFAMDEKQTNHDAYTQHLTNLGIPSALHKYILPPEYLYDAQQKNTQTYYKTTKKRNKKVSLCQKKAPENNK